MKNKVLAAVLVAATAVMMTAGSVSAASYAEDAKIKVWGSQEDQEMLQGIITSFKEKYPEAANWTIETAVVSSADAKTEDFNLEESTCPATIASASCPAISDVRYEPNSLT